jgi:hypothetical protein
MSPSVLFMDEKDALHPIGNMALLQESMGNVSAVARVPTAISVSRRYIGRHDERRIRMANFPLVKTLDGIDWSL